MCKILPLNNENKRDLFCILLTLRYICSRTSWASSSSNFSGSSNPSSSSSTRIIRKKKGKRMEKGQGQADHLREGGKLQGVACLSEGRGAGSSD